VCELCNGLERYVEVEAIWHHSSPYGLDDIYPKAKIGFDWIPKSGKGIIVCGTVLWNLIDMGFLDNYNDVKVIVPDGPIMRHRDKFNAILKDYDVFATNCKYQFFDYPVKEYYQPFDMSWLKIEKNERLTVAHGYFSERKKRQKGTDFIEGVLRNIDADTDLYTKLSWYSAVIRKSKAHIYIDQIDHFDGWKFGWQGGIGKSGLEAMLLDCVVMCRGEFHGREIPTPPIAWCNKVNISDILDMYINDEKARRLRVEEQREWANKYLTKDFCARHVLRI